MPKKVKGIATTVKRKIKFLKIEDETLKAYTKKSELLISTHYATNEGLELQKMFANKSYLKINKTLIIQSK